MVSRGAVYRKSNKGTEAIAARLHGLTPRLRSVLIVVDGKKTGEDLLRFAANLGDAEVMMGELLDGGFIEPVAGTEPASSPSGVTETSPPAQVQPDEHAPEEPVAPKRPGIPLADAKRLAVRRLTDLMGPMADDLCIGIESAKDPDQFMAAVRKAYNMLKAVRGSAAATRFSDEVEANFP